MTEPRLRRPLLPGNLRGTNGVVHFRWRFNHLKTLCWASSSFDECEALCVNGRLGVTDAPVNCLVCLTNRDAAQPSGS